MIEDNSRMSDRINTEHTNTENSTPLVDGEGSAETASPDYTPSENTSPDHASSEDASPDHASSEDSSSINSFFVFFLFLSITFVF